IDVNCTVHPGAVEQNGFLRQPREMGTVRGLQRDTEVRRRSLGAVDFFGRRGRRHETRALPGRDVDVETIAAGHAAGGVDKDGREALGFGRGKAYPQRPRLMQMATAGDALRDVHVEGYRAPRPVGRKYCRRRTDDLGLHLSLGPAFWRSPRSFQSAIWRLISPGSS